MAPHTGVENEGPKDPEIGVETFFYHVALTKVKFSNERRQRQMTWISENKERPLVGESGRDRGA